MAYSQSASPESPHHLDQTRLYKRKVGSLGATPRETAASLDASTITVRG
jgi:hypothetical protein